MTGLKLHCGPSRRLLVYRRPTGNTCTRVAVITRRVEESNLRFSAGTTFKAASPPWRHPPLPG